MELVTGSHAIMEANPEYYLGPYRQLIFDQGDDGLDADTGEVGYSAPSPPFGDVARLRSLGMKNDEAPSQIVQ